MRPVRSSLSIYKVGDKAFLIAVVRFYFSGVG